MHSVSALTVGEGRYERPHPTYRTFVCSHCELKIWHYLFVWRFFTFDAPCRAQNFYVPSSGPWPDGFTTPDSRSNSRSSVTTNSLIPPRKLVRFGRCPRFIPKLWLAKTLSQYALSSRVRSGESIGFISKLGLSHCSTLVNRIRRC